MNKRQKTAAFMAASMVVGEFRHEHPLPHPHPDDPTIEPEIGVTREPALVSVQRADLSDLPIGYLFKAYRLK
jgi:hypothetical protein